MTETIVLTGFTPFGDMSVNPSQLIVEAIREDTSFYPGMTLTAEIIPTEF